MISEGATFRLPVGSSLLGLSILWLSCGLVAYASLGPEDGVRLIATDEFITEVVAARLLCYVQAPAKLSRPSSASRFTTEIVESERALGFQPASHLVAARRKRMAGPSKNNKAYRAAHESKLSLPAVSVAHSAASFGPIIVCNIFAQSYHFISRLLGSARLQDLSSELYLRHVSLGHERARGHASKQASAPKEEPARWRE